VARNDKKNQLIEYLRQRVGRAVTLRDIATDHGWTDQQAQQAMYRVIRYNWWPVTTVNPGHLWLVHDYNGNDAESAPEPDPDAFVGRVVERLGDRGAVVEVGGHLWSCKRIGVAE
jgi:hypothetical protein